MKKSALLLLTGIALGIAAGLLLAPEEGSKTRKKWWKKGKKYKKAFEEKLSEYQTNYLQFMNSLGAIYKHFSAFLLANKPIEFGNSAYEETARCPDRLTSREPRL